MALPKQSASLLVARLVENPATNNGFDYKILHLARSKSMKWGGALAYPGGSIEKGDHFYFSQLDK